MSDFKHISVTPADDDVVIRVGSDGSNAAPRRAEGTAAEGAAAKSVPAEGASAASAPDTGAPAADAPRPKARDGYRETTLADLEREKMPLAQRIVIIAAVVCIIGAVAYYFMFMR